MDELLKVLQTHGETIRAAWDRQVSALGRQHSCLDEAEMGRLVATMKAAARGETSALNSWASRWTKAALAAGRTVGEVCSALGGVEAAYRTMILQECAGEKNLAVLLHQLADLMEQVRQRVIAEWLDQASHLPEGLGSGSQPPGAGEASANRGRSGTSDSMGERLPSSTAELEADHRIAAALVALLEEEDLCICLADQHGRPFYFNRAARRAFGLEEKQSASAVRLAQLYSEESWMELRDVAVPAVNQSGRWKGRSEIRHVGSGKITEYETHLRLIKVPGGERGSCLAIVHRPVSELRRLQEALAEVEARKHAILETSLDPIITINAAGQITEFNRAAEMVFGYSRQEVLGRTPSELLFPPSDSPSQQNRIERYLESGEGSQLGRRMEITARRANGELFPAEMTMTLSQEHGEPVLTFFLRDISQRKQAEEEQARYAAELERSNRELEQFAYIASHDLQEPLRKIRTFGDRLQAKCGPQLDELGRECLSRMQDAAERMQRLIDGLLTLSRVTTQGQQFVPVNLEEVVREVVRDLEMQIEKVQGRVEVGHLPTIQADPLQMRQLFQNLIGNALKFHRPEEPPLVRVSGRYLRDRTQRAANPSEAEEFCRIVVEDNGIGFEEKYLDRIFNMFQRLHPRDHYEGTGVGLAICRKIVQRHGGTITAQSTPGKGSTFICLLPVFHRAKKEKEKESEIP